MEINILGPLEVRDGERILEPGGGKQRALLADLAIHLGEPLSPDRLISDLWGDSPPATAAKTLQALISRLRKTLGREAVLTSGGGYVLADGSTTDAQKLERLLREARDERAAGNEAVAGDRLGTALKLFRGRPLAEFTFEEFAQSEIARLEELRLSALEERIEHDLAQGRHRELVPELESLVGEHPLRERLRAQLMLALYRAGRQAEALDVYAATRRTLLDELGIEPGRALRELQQSILQQEPALDVQQQRVRPAADATRGTFVGREAELGALLAGLDDAVAGRGRLFLVAGEPGIGKSRLADELGDHARRAGAKMVWGRSWEAGGAPAYWPWVQALRACIADADAGALQTHLGRGGSELAHLLPELREELPGLADLPTLDSESSRFRLFEATAMFLQSIARSQPLVIVLDDLHAADEPSLLLLRYVAREISDSRVLVIAAYRDVDPTISASLSEAIEYLVRQPSAQRVDLRGLPEPAVAAYIHEATGASPPDAVVDRIFSETDGNPLFVGEIVRMLTSEGRLREDPGRARLALPGNVRETIVRRVNRLPPESVKVLMLASILGREFDLDTLQRLADVERGPLLELLEEPLAERIVAELPDGIGRMRFAHALIRDAIYEELTPIRRARLHREAGEALEAHYGHDLEPHLAELAHHFYESAQIGRAGDAVEYAHRAGERAVGLLAFEEATRLFGLGLEALELQRPVDETKRCELLLATGDAEARAGDGMSAQETFRAAADIARRLGLADPLARAALGNGGRYVFGRAGDNRHLVPLLREALVALGDREDAIRSKVLARLATALRDEHSLQPREQLSREALEIARRLDDPATLVWALTARHAATASPTNLEERLELSTEVIEIAAAQGDPERQVEGHRYRFIDAFERGDIDGCLRDLETAARLTTELRQPVHMWSQKLSSAMVSLFNGRYEDAEREGAEAREIGAIAQRFDAEFCYRLQLCALRREQGRLRELEPLLRRSTTEYPSRAVFACYVAVLAVEQTDADRALALLRSLAQDGLTPVSPDVEWLVNATLLAEVAAALGERQAAHTVYDALLPYEARMAVTFTEISTGAVARYLGLLAASLGDRERAVEHFEAALDLNTRMGGRPWTAHTACDYAALLLREPGASDRARASELLELAGTTAQELGMVALSDRISAVRQASGATAR